MMMAFTPIKNISSLRVCVLSVIFCTLIVSGLSFVSPVYACPAGQIDTGRQANRGVEDCVPDPAAKAQASTGNADNSGDSSNESSSEAEWGNPLTWTFSAILSPVAVLMWVIFKITSLLLGLAGILFNFVMATLVFKFSTYLGNSPGMVLAWGILRDFGNIGLIFGFVFMGIATILDLHSYPWKKALPALVIYAVLLNFSLFAAEAVIDSTNVLAATLYDQTYDGKQCIGDDWLGCVVNTGIAGAVLDRVNITSVFGDGIGEIGEGIIDQIKNPIGNILKFTLLAIVTSVAAFVLLAGAMMLLSRAILLAFLMVTSPIGFAGMAIPPLQKLAKDWWHKLINQALFAPVFILLLLVALKMTDGINQLGSAGGLAKALDPAALGSGTGAGTLLVFALIMGFMIGALMLASKFGIYGADLAIKTAGGAVYGSMGWMGRRAFGEPARRIAQNLNQSRFGTETVLGRNLARLAGTASKSSMDFRGTGAFKLAKGVDVGKTSDIGKKGRVGEIDASNKRRNEEAKAKVDARKAQDGIFKQREADLKRDEDLARANADIAERRRNPEQAAAFRQEAEQIAQQRAANDAEFARVRKDRLSVDDRKIKGYYERTTTDSERERDESEHAAAEAAARFAEASDRMAQAAERMEQLQAEAPAGARTQAQIDADLRAAEAMHDAAEMERETAGIERETAERNHANAQAEHERRLKRSEKYNTDIADPKYAMEQYARSLDELSRTFAGQFLDPTKLRAGATDVRKNKGKSHTDHVLEEFKELMEGHHGHDDHAAPAHPPAAAAPAGDSGGGGHADPHAH